MLDPAALAGLEALPGASESRLVRRVIALFLETSCPLGQVISTRGTRVAVPRPNVTGSSLCEA